MSIVKLEAGEPNTKPLLRKITHGKSVDVEDEYDLFKSIDPNNNGFVHSKDLIEAISISTDLFGLTREQAEELVRDIDANKDDQIDFPEFCTLMAKAKHMHMRRIVLYATQSVLGRNQQVEAFRYITPYHNCSPPPVFIIVVTIIQIAIYAYFRTSIYDLDQSGYSGFYRRRLSPWDDDSDSNERTWTIRMYCDYVIDRDTIATNSYTKCQLYHKLTDNPKHPWEIWRAFTSVFLHSNVMHLIGNLSIQILLGIPLELVHKAKRIAPIYFLGALLGHFMFLASEPDTTWAVGASGAVFALVGAHVANTAINWSEMRFQWLRLIFSILVVLKVLDEVAKTFLGYNTGVGHLDHLGGFIGGFLLGIGLLRNVRIHRWERVAKIASIATFILLNVICICMMIYNSEPKIEDSKPVFEPAVTEAPEVADGPCEIGWRYFNQTNSCYHKGRSMEYWVEARGYCQTRGSDLASIHSEEENNFVAEIAAPHNTPYIWIGLHRITDQVESESDEDSDEDSSEDVDPTSLNGTSSLPDLLNSTSKPPQWKWSDGTSFDFDFWYPGEPGPKYGENCVEIRAWKESQQWNDVGCGEGRRKFVCKKKLIQ